MYRPKIREEYSAAGGALEGVIGWVLLSAIPLDIWPSGLLVLSEFFTLGG
jgi:hypothetical protein